MEEEYKPLSEYITVSNEYSYVKIRKVSTRNGVRLEIFSPRADTHIYLDPLELEHVSRTDKKFFDLLLGINRNENDDITDDDP